MIDRMAEKVVRDLFTSPKNPRTLNPMRPKRRAISLKENQGTVLIEFAIVFPIFLLTMIAAIDIALAMLATMNLTYVTQAATTLETTHPGTATAWAKQQLPQATFTATTAPCGTQITASLPLQTLILPLPALRAQACWPT